MASDHEEVLGPTWQNIYARTTNSLRFTGTISPADSGIPVEIVIEDTIEGNKYVIGIENDTSGGFKFDYSTSEVTTVTKVNTNITTLNTDDLIEFRVVDDTVTFHINGTQYATATLDWLHTPIWLYAQSWSSNNGNFSIKEFRVKRTIS